MQVPRRAARALQVVSGELATLDPRLLLARMMIAPLPRLSFCRLRAGLYRLAGLEVGAGTLVLGALELGGGKGASGRLRIGARCMLNVPLFIDLNDEIRIGDEVNIGHHTLLITSRHRVGSAERRAGLLETAPVVLEHGCWLGARVTVLPGVTVGRGAVVAAGAVVTKDVPPNTMVAGIPARVLKQLPDRP
jgi:maltose O-acetyltransferase